MKSLNKASILAAATFAMIAVPASSHHSYGAFDRSKQGVVTGTVTKFEWTNPHSWVHVMAPGPNGKPVEYHIEMGPPGQLARTGWKRNTIKAGDKVSVTVNPLKDGTPGGHLLQVKAADNKIYYDSIFGSPPKS